MRATIPYLILVALLAALAMPFSPARATPVATPEVAPTAGTAAGARERGAVRGSRGPLLVVLRIAEALQLSDAQTIKLAGEFRRVAQRRRTLLAEKAALNAKLEAVLAQRPLDEGELTRVTEQAVALERELVLLPESLWKAIQPELTPEQRARLILLRGKLKQQVDDERQRRRGKRRDGAAAD